MARARSLKPGYFTNEELADCGVHAHLLFAGLWTVADRAGRFDDRPRRLKVQLMPFYEVNVDELLNTLESAGFINRYTVDGEKYIQIINFDKHQNPHVKEQPSTIPEPVLPSTSTGKSRKSRNKHESKTPLTLNPITDSLNPVTHTGAAAPDGLDQNAWTRWLEYRKQIRRPLKPVSIPAAQQELAAFGCDQAAVVQQSIANGYQGLFPLKPTGPSGSARGHPPKLSPMQRAIKACDDAFGPKQNEVIHANAERRSETGNGQDDGSPPRLFALPGRLADDDPGHG